MKKVIQSALLSFIVIGAAHAGVVEDITFTLDSPTLYVAPGGSISFTGYFTNADQDASDAGIDVNFDSADSFLPADASITDNFFGLLSPLAPNTESDDFDLFDISVADDDAPGTYQINDTFYGGIDDNASDVLTVITATVVVTPEPSTIALLGTGAAFLAFGFRRRRR